MPKRCRYVVFECSIIPFAPSPSTALRRALSKGKRDFGMFTKWVVCGSRPCFDKALLSAAEGLSMNGFNTPQLRF
jgi:hypothetical protein